jgi:hypothetical protein
MRYELAPINTRPWLLNGLSLREAGFDAKYMKGGHSAWKALGGAIKLYM